MENKVLNMNWRSSRDYRVWRALVIRKDKVCQLCGSRHNRHAHHLNHATYYPGQRFYISNGICLCGLCHSYYHNKFHGSTRKKCTTKSFNKFKNWFSLLKDCHE